MDQEVIAKRKFRESNIKNLFSKLNNHDQTMIYDLIWTIGAKDMSNKLYKDRLELLETKK